MKDTFICQYCKKTKTRDCKPSQVGKRKYCDRECQHLGYKTRFAGSNNPAYGRVYRTKATHPEWANNISCAQKELGNMIGDKNPMRNPDTALKMSKTRRKNVTSDPEYRKNLSIKTSKAWADGKFDEVPVGKCKWFDHEKPDGTIVKCQGTWELAFARWLDEQGLTYTAHRGRISYTSDEGKKRNYYPDFWVEEWDSYVDIKNEYHLSLQPKKLDMVKKSNPDIKIRLLLEDELRDMGVL